MNAFYWLMQAEAPATHVFLVHGVGLPAPDLFGRELEEKLLNVGIPKSHIRPINWHEKVYLPYEDPEKTEWPLRTINFKQIAGLMRGLTGAAALPGPKNFWFPRFLYFLLHCLAMCAPVFAFWGFYLTVGSRLVGSGGTRLASLLEPIQELGTALYGAIPEKLSWLPRAYLMTLGIVVTLVIVAHTTENALQGLLAGVRKCVICFTWPVVYVVALCASWLGAGYAALYVIFIGGNVFGNLYDHVTINANGVIVAGWSMDALVLGALPVMLASWAAALFVLIAARFLMWFFKVLADVACFAGDPVYAETLIEHVRTEFTNAAVQPNDTVVIVGHSLGSAICLNCLLHLSSVFPREARIVFVTLGSPITRWLGRFFPGSMPKADPAAAYLRSQYGAFRWINAYRPFDPIGGALFTHAEPPFTYDISTKQYWKFLLGAHIGYWDDDTALQAASRAITESNSLDLRTSPTEKQSFQASPTFGDPLPLRFNRLLGAVWLRTVVALALVLLVVCNIALQEHREISASNTPLLMKSGVVTSEGWLYRYYETNPNAGRAEAGAQAQVPVDFYIVVFKPAGTVNQIACRVDPLAVRWRLEDVFGTEGQQVSIKQRGGWFDVPATRIRIPVRYLPTDPTVFDFPTLRPKSGRDSFLYEFEILWSVFWITLVLVGPLFLWLLPLYVGCDASFPFKKLLD